jgi:putative ABC transport system permease protein
VLGIARDFNLASLHEAVEPMRFTLMPERFRTFVVRTRAGNAAAAMAALESAWEEVFSDALFEARFADTAFDAAYRAEERLGLLFTLFAGLAVFIACLGLFGLAAYAAEQRRKEIGIRKVLGASAGSVVALLSRDFVTLVVAGFAVAVPVAWFAMARWLEGFAYHVDLGLGPFLAAAGVALGVALLAVSGQALRAAHADPVHALRSE